MSWRDKAALDSVQEQPWRQKVQPDEPVEREAMPRTARSSRFFDSDNSAPRDTSDASMRQVRDASRYAQASEHQDSLEIAGEGETSVTIRGLGQPESFGTRAIAKLGQTGGQIFGGLARSAVALGDYGSEVLGEAPGDNAVRQSLVDLARRGELISANRVVGAPTWEETKKNPWLYPSLIAHEIPGALAYSGMMASPLGVGTIGSSFAGNIGQERALNDGRMEATAGDVLKGAPFAAGSVALERLGAKYLGFLGDELTGGVAARIGKAALGEGITEASQSVIEGLGGSLGTERGVDGAELADQAFAGAAIGFGTGGAIRGGTEAVGGLQTAVASRRRAQLSITAEDEASPLNTDDIVNGRAAQMEAEANQAGETGINLPRVGGRVAVTLPGAAAPIEATFTETFSDDSGVGIVLTLDNGQTVREYTDAIRDAGVKIENLEEGASEVQPPAAPAPSTSAPAFDMQRYMRRNRAAESSGNDSARASTSSATGRYQFVEGTWLEYYKRTFGETGETREQILAKRTDGNVQDRVMERFTRDNVAAVERAGAPVTDGNVYLAHFLGASTAQKVLQVAPGTPINQVVGRDQINANKSILEGKTAAEVIAWAARKMGSPVPQGDGLASATRPEREPFNPEGFQPRTDANIGRKIPFRSESERETAVVPATLQEVPVRYALAELDDLVPSNLSDGRINPDFPAERQPRDRTRAASQSQVRQISTRLYPRLLARDVKTSDGAPIVDASGVVDSGNGRVMALSQAYEANDGNIEAYKQMLEDEGFDATGMNKPVLVRVREDMAPEDVAKFVRDSNARSTASMSGIETAASDAAALPASLLSLYKGGDLDTLANSDFVKGFAQAFLPASEIGAMVMKDGRPNANLLRRIDAALLVRALGPQSFIEWIVDARGGKVKSLGNALIEISGKLAQLREAAAQGIVDPSVDISDNIAEAVTVIDRARREDRDVSEFVYQTDAFSGDMNPRTVAVLRAMFKDKKQFKNQVSQEKLVATFNFYIDEAMKAAPNGGLIEASPEDVAADILELANARQTDPTAKPARKEQRDADTEQGGFSLLDTDGQDVRVPSEPSGERGGAGLQDGSREQGESEGVAPEPVAPAPGDSRGTDSTAPEHANVGATDAELKDVVVSFKDRLASMGEGDQKVSHVFDPPKKGEIVRLADKAKVFNEQRGGWMTVEEAQREIAKWKANAQKQGLNRETAIKNSDKVVLSLFDLSGEWSKPWREAGYDVWQFDIQADPTVGNVNNFSTDFFGDWFGDFEGKDIYAILAACPCTDFASSGARHFAAKDKDGRTVSSVKLVNQTLATIEYFKPAVWALENPVGRIEKLGGLPPWRLSFDPNHIGEPYTKKTLIWGRFDGDMPVAPVEPTEGSKMWAKYGGKSLATKNARSVTPEGFAYSFFQANNAIDNPVMAIANKYDRLDRDLIEQAVKKGVSEQDLSNAIDDPYYIELDDTAAEQAIRDLIDPRRPPAADAASPGAQPAATPSYTITDTPSGKGIAVKYGSTAQLEQVERLVPEAKASKRSDGAYTYSKKHRAAIENVLEAMGGATETVTPASNVAPDGSLTTEGQRLARTYSDEGEAFLNDMARILGDMRRSNEMRPALASRLVRTYSNDDLSNAYKQARANQAEAMKIRADQSNGIGAAPRVIVNELNMADEVVRQANEIDLPKIEGATYRIVKGREAYDLERDGSQILRMAPADSSAEVVQKAVKSAIATARSDAKAKAATGTNMFAEQGSKSTAGKGVIGQNSRGQDVFEDERGVRSYVENGIRITESVGIVPGGGFSIDLERRWDEFKTVSELGQERAAKERRIGEEYDALENDMRRAQAELDAFGADQDATYKSPGIKGRARVIEKAVNEDGYNSARDIKDLARSAFIVDSMSQADALMQAIGERFTIVQDKGWKTLDSGYADHKIIVESNGIKAEIQIVPAPMWRAKKDGGANKLYKEQRTPGISEERFAELQQQQQEIYSAALVGTDFESLSNSPKSAAGNSRSASSRESGTPSLVANPGASAQTESSRQTSARGGDTENTAASRNSTSLNVGDTSTSTSDVGANPQESNNEGTRRFEKNTLFTADKVEAARARMRERKNRLNAGVDPEMLIDGMVIAGAYIEEGVRNFADYSKAMRADFGDWINPYLLSFWEGARNYPGLDTEGMTSPDASKAMHEMLMATSAPETATQGQENNDADVQDGLSDSDGGASPADVQAPAQDRGARGARRQESGGGQEALFDFDGRSGADGQRGDRRPASAQDGNRAGVRDADRVSERDGTDGSRSAGDVKGRNWLIEPGSLAEDRGPAQKARDNIAAIETVKRVKAEGRLATRDEQALISRYVGWGGLKNAFPDAQGNYGKGFEQIGPRLRELLTDSEYDTARRSIQYAHYTAEPVVRQMWQIAWRLGFKGGTVFEPGMGTGNFLGMMPKNVAGRTQYSGLEFDGLTADIAKLLYPESGVRHADYTETPRMMNAVDLAIGNPPFSETVVSGDKDYGHLKFVLHDFFFAKTLDAVKPGGVLMFVTSAGTMNKKGDKARKWLAERADLVGAIRLPGNAFKQNAGTEVTTDIVILRKRAEGEPAGDASWTETVPVAMKDRDGNTVEGNVNRYFVENPKMVLGEQGMFDKLVSGPRYAVRAPANFDLVEALGRAVDALPRDIMKPASRDEGHRESDIDLAATERKDGSFYVASDNRLMVYRNGVGVPVEAPGKGVKGGISKDNQERIRKLIPVRDALRAVYAADLNEDSAAADKARAELNKTYDAFVAKFGPINKQEVSYRPPSRVQVESARAKAREEARLAGKEWDDGSFDPSPLEDRNATLAEIARERDAARDAAAKAGRMWNEGSFDPADVPETVIAKHPNLDAFLASDEEGYRLAAIESYNPETGQAKKGLVFERSVVRLDKQPEIATTQDALFYSLNQRGRPDIALISELTGKSADAVLDDLKDRVFAVPDRPGDYETAEVYLSGDVRAKLAIAQDAAKQDSTYQRNVAALEQALPRPLTQSEIAANLGMPWLPPKVVEQFATEHMGLKTATVKYVGALSQWTAAGDSYSAAARAVWGAGGRNALDLLEAALNRRRVRVLKKMSDGSTILDVTATEAATAKIAEMKEAFSQWVYSDPARTTELVELYNRDFNSLVAPKFNGDYLTTPGLNAAWKWRPHQSAVIARIIQSGNTYMAHEVGSGKTSASIGAAMEMKRLGMVNKPMFVVPNHMLGQFSKEFLEQYPLAKIRVADETRFHTSRRKEFIAQVAAEDLDAIIITHSSFKMIPLSNEFVESMILEEISELERTLNEIDKSERVTRRNIEQQKESLEQRLKGLTRGRKDQVFTFEEMGVDYLFVDEAHEFRKLDFATKMGDVKGIDPQGSAASYDLFAKVRYLESKRPGRSVTLMSGTPITNTMAELYSVSRYLQMPELEKRGLAKFDAWAGAYGDTVTALEQDPAGGYKSQTRFAKFVNVPELSVMVRQVMDVVSAADLRKYVTLPELKGGERQMVIAEQTAAQSDYQDQLKRRMEAIQKRSGPPKKGDDILLSVIGDGRKNAIDARLVDPSAPKDPNSKLELMIENVARIYKETKRVPLHKPQQGGYSEKPVDYGPATQMIFSDFGINGDFPVHKYIKNQLVQRGIPAKHIALMSDFNKHVAKQRLFNDMNEGKVRILIGSVAKMGTGVNAQQRLIASHNVDPQWYPANDTQRNGRIIRQGNMNPEVEIFDYSTEGTYDSQMWALMAKKARFIEGFMRGDPDMRDMEDLGEASQYEQAQALTTSDPRVMQLVELKQERDKLHLRKLATERREIEARQTLKTARNRVSEAEQEIAAIEQDIAKAQIPAEFTGTVGGNAFTERAEFGAALLEAVGELDDKLGNERSVRERVGEYAGFTIDAELRISFNEPVRNFYVNRSGGRENRVEVSTSALGQATRIENVIKGFESEKAGAEAYRKRYQDEIEQYENLTFEVFGDQPRITELDNEIAALEKVLEAENKAKEGSPTAEDFEDAAEVVVDGRAIDNQGNARPLDSRPDGPDLFDAPQQPERTMTQAQRAELEVRQKQQMARRGGQQGLGDQEGGLFSSERDQGSLFLRTADGEPITETQAKDLEADLRKRLDALGLQRVQLRVTTRQQIEPTRTNPPDGRYYPSMKLIEVASNAVNGSTFVLDHEAIHALRDLGAFNKTDWTLLKKAAWDASPELVASIKRRYPDLHEEAQIEEAVADRFAEYQQNEATGFTGSVIRIIRNTLKLFEAIRNALRGKGFVTDRRPVDVLEDIRTGRTAQDIGRFETGNAVNKRRNSETPTGGLDQFAEASDARAALPLFENALDRDFPDRNEYRISSPTGVNRVMSEPAARRAILLQAISNGEYEAVYESVMRWRGESATFGSVEVSFGKPAYTSLDSRPATTLADLGGTDPTWKGKTAKVFEAVRTAMQDRYLPLLSVQRRIETMTGQRLPNSMNPYLGEELMAGRIGSRLDALHTDTIGPLFDDMARSKITTDELESYLYARHAPERNARMQSINPELGMGEGSGMTDIEAAAIMNRVRDEGKMADMERLAAQVDKMRDDALDYRVQTGLMSQKQADEWRATYDYYVPLRGFAEVEGEMSEETADRINRSGGGINVRGPESKRAFGRRSKAESPLAYLILQAEEAIVRGETNRVAQRFVALARANPDDDFWKVNKVTMARRMNEESGQVEEYVHYNLAAADKDWTVVAKENGKEVRVTMNRANPAARRLADSMRNLTQHQLDWVTRYLGTVNRFLSAANTSYNPEFVITNAFRDMQTAAINLQGIEVEKITRRTSALYAGALVAATKGSWGKGSGEWGDWYQQFIKAGGRVYFNQTEDIGLIRKRIDSAFELAAARAGDKVGARVHVKRGLLAVRDAIENTNLGVENAVRLAAFRAAREAGVDADKAASIAKNLTVNFNRRGTFGPVMNAAYLFYNASMQGSVRILAAAKHPKVQKMLAGIAVAGAMNELLNMMVSGDDDDGESYYDKIPAWEKSRNMIFMLPGGSSYIKIPLPYGYGAVWEAGRTTSEIARRGGDRWKDSAGNLLSTIVDSFNPVGGAQSLMNFFAPTILDPVVDLERNADFTGRPIMPKDNPFDVDEPDAQRYFGSVGTHWRAVTDFLTDATGGSKVEPGAIDVSPETLEYLAGVVFGAAGGFIDRVAGVPDKLVKGELETNDVPFARKVYGSEPGWLDTTNYYDRVAEVERTYEYTKRYIEGEQLDEARSYAERNEKVLTLVPAMREAQKFMREVRKEKREIAFEYEMGRLTDEERRTRYDRAKEVEDRIVTAFNTRWNQTLYSD